jgi:hypothetical protein
VTLAGASLSGTDAGNYTLGSVSSDSADITPKPIDGGFRVANKLFDGTTSATIVFRALAGVVSPDVVTLSDGTATFDDPNVGTGKTVTGTGFTLAGADASNYTLNLPVAGSKAAITQRPPAGGTPPPTVTVVVPKAIQTKGSCQKKPLLAFVKGEPIEKVVYRLNGKRIAVVRKADAKHRWGTKISRKLVAERGKKLRAKVFFAAAADHAAVTRKLKLTQCAAKG